MINHVYDPLVDAARTNSPHGQKLLEQLGEKLLNANPGCCHSVEDGMRLARINLSLYANFFPPPVVDQVRVYYGLAGFP